MTPISLEISFGSRTRPFRLTAARITIGSAPASTLVLPLSFVQPAHLEFEHGRLLSRVRTTSPAAIATLDGYPIGPEWTLLPRKGVIEIPGPSGGGGVTIKVSLEPHADVRPPQTAPIAAPPSATFQAPPQIPMPMRATVPPPPPPTNSLLHMVPLIVAGVLLVALVVGLLVIDMGRPIPPPVAVAPTPAPPAAAPAAPPPAVPAAPSTAAPPSSSLTAPPASKPTVVMHASPETLPPPPHFAPYVAPPPSATDRALAVMRNDVERSLAKNTKPTTAPADLDRRSVFDRATAAVAERLDGAGSIAFASPDTPGGAVVTRDAEGAYLVRGRVTTTNQAGVPLRQLYRCVVKKGADGAWAVEHAAVMMP